MSQPLLSEQEIVAAFAAVGTVVVRTNSHRGAEATITFPVSMCVISSGTPRKNFTQIGREGDFLRSGYPLPIKVDLFPENGASRLTITIQYVWEGITRNSLIKAIEFIAAELKRTYYRIYIYP